MGQGRMRKWPLILVVRSRTVLLALNINEMCRCDLVPEREKEKQTDCKGDWGKRRKKKGREEDPLAFSHGRKRMGRRKAENAFWWRQRAAGGGYASGRGLHCRMSYV